jgi:hypothetical protein
MQRIEFNSQPSNPFSGLISLAIGVLFLIGMFFAIKWVFIGLLIISPILLLVTFMINDKIVLNYFQSLWNKLKTNILSGLIGILTMPFSFFGLFLQALLLRKVEKVQSQFHQNMNQQMHDMGNMGNPKSKQYEDEYVDYEEIKEDDNLHK